jgi:hypothetical protein
VELETWIKAAWLSLVAVHLMPAVVLFVPSMTEKLYGISPTGDVGILTIHRGALFLAILAAALMAVFDPATRRMASIIVAISVVGFLFVYARAGMPAGALRSIALVDLIAVIPLIFVSYHAWRA